MAVRAAVCRAAAIRLRRRHLLALIDVLADYGTLSDDLPFPCQTTMARDLGVNERTVRRWVAELEGLGLIVVRRSRPVRDPESGRWSRKASNRYIVADRLARRSVGACCPLPRRRLSPLVPPTGHDCPVTAYPLVKPEDGGRFEPAGPPDLVVSAVVELPESSSPSAPAPIGVELAGPQVCEQAERERVAGLLASMRSTLGPTRRRFGR